MAKNVDRGENGEQGFKYEYCPLSFLRRGSTGSPFSTQERKVVGDFPRIDEQFQFPSLILRTKAIATAQGIGYILGETIA